MTLAVFDFDGAVDYFRFGDLHDQSLCRCLCVRAMKQFEELAISTAKLSEKLSLT